MFGTLMAVYNVLRAGESVANPAAWKKGQVTGSILATFLGSLLILAKAFGVDLPVSSDQLIQVGSAIVTVIGLFNAGITVASSDKIGLPAKPVEYPILQAVAPIAEAMSTPNVQSIRPAAVERASDGSDYTGS